MQTNEKHAKYLIAGSGFSGSLTAMILQQQARAAGQTLPAVLVFDSAQHPRFAIGESSTPAADFVLRDLATRYDLPRLIPLTRYGPWCREYPDVSRGRKRGFSYFHHRRGEEFEPRDDHANELLVAASSSDEVSDTHWFRSDVDAFLANELQSLGIPLFENVTIEQVTQSAAGWQLDGIRAGEPIEFHGEFLIDATGHGGLLRRHLEIADHADQLKTNSWALYAHWTDVPLWEGFLRSHGAKVDDYPYPCDAAALHHLFDDGWMWQLRFDNRITSAGFVFDGTKSPPPALNDPNDLWHTRIEEFPSVANAYWKAQIPDAESGLHCTQRMQRLAETIAGDNWAMLPSTAGIVDPLHSTGIGHAMCGIEFLTNVLAEKDVTKRHAGLQQYSARVRAELLLIDRLVAACYATLPRFDAFVTCTMVYFVATIAWESRRKEFGDFAHDAFLCATDDELTSVLFDLTDRAMSLNPQDNSAVESFIREAESSVAKWNTVGLFRPTVPNMYHHTAPE